MPIPGQQPWAPAQALSGGHHYGFLGFGHRGGYLGDSRGAQGGQGLSRPLRGFSPPRMHRHVVLPHPIGLQVRQRELLQAAGRLPEDPVQRSEPPSYEEVVQDGRGRPINEDPAPGRSAQTAPPSVDLAAAQSHAPLDGHSHQHNLLHCAEPYVGGDGNSDGEVP